MEEMTKERLSEYRSNKAEIEELKYKLAHLGEGDSMIGNDVILDYTKGYPRPQSVVGRDEKRQQALQERWTKRIAKLETECLAVELWIEAIPDSLTRRIFRMHYVDGLRQDKVAKKIHISQSAVSGKISTFLKSDNFDKKV